MIYEPKATLCRFRGEERRGAAEERRRAAVAKWHLDGCTYNTMMKLHFNAAGAACTTSLALSSSFCI